MIPLWRYDQSSCEKLIKDYVPKWAGFRFASKGKYRGFWLGHGASDDSWLDPVAKWEERAKYIRGLGVGFTISILLYRVLALPCLQFVAQLYPIPGWVLKKETSVLDTIAGGPYRWITTQAFHNIDHLVGFPVLPPSLQVVGHAALARCALVSVSSWPSFMQLIDDGWASDNRLLLPTFSDWYKRSSAVALREAHSNLKNLSIVSNGRITDEQMSLLLRAHYCRKAQKRLAQLLRPVYSQFSFADFLCHRWARWFRVDHVRFLVARAQQVVRELKDKVPACVLHAVLIT